MKSVRLPITGHPLLAVERYWDETRHMIEFLVLKDCPLGREGRYIRRYLSESGYQDALQAQKDGSIRVCKHFTVIEGHILPDKPKKKRRK